jgi:CheY-like chemotaxis protein
MTGMEWLAGRKVLVVEDEYFLADDVAKGLEANGAEVIGPVGDIDGALDLIEDSEGLDAAVLDLNLPGGNGLPGRGRVAGARRALHLCDRLRPGRDSGAIWRSDAVRKAGRCAEDRAGLVRVSVASGH